jgi:hypothetical protein
MKGVYIMGEKTEFINGCPICHHQGKMSLMEGVNGENYIICPVHGIISNKFWHDIFIDLSWAESISPTQPLIVSCIFGQIYFALLSFVTFELTLNNQTSG